MGGGIFIGGVVVGAVATGLAMKNNVAGKDNSELNLLQQQLERLTAEKDTLSKKNKALYDELDSCNAEIRKLKDKLFSQQDLADDNASDLNLANQKYLSLKDENERLKIKLSEGGNFI